MSVAYSPRTISDGLVLSLDFGNEKSWKGRPTTNQFLVPVPDVNGNVAFTINGTGTFQRVYSGTYDGYAIKSSDIVYKYVLGAAPTGCHYHGNSVAIGSGQYVTWSFDFYVSPDVTSYVTNYLANLENYAGSALGVGIIDAAPTIFGKWKRVTQTFGPTGGTGTQAMFLYPGGCGSQLATQGYILYKNPQVEFTSTNIGPSQFVSGSRSGSQAIIDQVNGYTATLTGTNFTYPYPVGGLTINNVNDSYVDITPATNLAMGTNDFTIGAWVRQNDTSANIVTEARGNNLLGYLFVLNYPSAGQMSMFINKDGTQNIYSITPSVALSTTSDQYLTVVVKRSSGSIFYYVNGQLAGTTTGVHFSSITDSSGIIHRLGYDRGGSTTNMTFYNYHVYNRGLSSTEVLQNYNALKGRFR